MNNDTRKHLTSEELDLAVADKAAAHTEQHLLGCERCAAEVVSMKALLHGLKEQAVLTAARYRHSQPTTRAEGRAMQGPSTFVPAWGMAFAAALLVVGGVVSPLVLRHRGAPAAPVVVTSPATQDALSDDALLSSVQNDLSTSVPAPLLPLAGTSFTLANPTSSNK